MTCHPEAQDFSPCSESASSGCSPCPPPPTPAAPNVAALQVAMSGLGLYPASRRRDHRSLDPGSGADLPGAARPDRRRRRRTADPGCPGEARQAEAGEAPDAHRPARLGRRGAPVPAPRAGLRAWRLRRRFRSQHAERGSALPVGHSHQGRWCRRAVDPERAQGHPGRHGEPDRARALLPTGARAHRRRFRLHPARPLAHRNRHPRAEGDADPRGRTSGSSPSPASTPAATATWS